MGYRPRREAEFIAQTLQRTNAALGTFTLGEVCATGLVKLEVACLRCDRKGCYRVTRLIDRFGAKKPMTEVKDLLASPCLKQQYNAYPGEGCGVFFPLLCNGLPKWIP